MAVGLAVEGAFVGRFVGVLLGRLVGLFVGLLDGLSVGKGVGGAVNHGIWRFEVVGFIVGEVVSHHGHSTLSSIMPSPRPLFASGTIPTPYLMLYIDRGRKYSIRRVCVR